MRRFPTRGLPDCSKGWTGREPSCAQSARLRAALGRAGIIGGRRCASHPSVAGELPSRDAGGFHCPRRKLITSQGAGTAVEFALEIASALFGGEKAAEVAGSICFKFPSGQC